MLIHLLMLAPLWYTGNPEKFLKVAYHVSVSAFQVISRHELLQMTIGVRDDETISYNIVHFMPIGMTTAVVLASWLGIASFLVYNYMVGCQYY